MAESPPSSSYAPPRLEDLVALNYEIAALVKARIPLELGLRGISGNVQFRLGQLAERLADRLSNGMSLVQALEQEGPAVSPVYTAVVGAGLESGRLGEALGALSQSSQIEQEARQRVSLALFYPAVVATLGYLLLVLFVVTVVPVYLETAEMFRFPDSIVFQWLRVLHQTVPLWGSLIPACVLLAIAALILMKGPRAGAKLAWNWVPGVAAVHRSLNQAQFVELLRLQVAHGLPLDRSLRRAGEATDDRHLRLALLRVSDDLSRGASLADALPRAKALPSMLRWMLATSERQGTLVETLHLLADSYRRKAIQNAALFKFWVPILATVCLSGVVVLIYSMIFFIPLRELWNGLMQE